MFDDRPAKTLARAKKFPNRPSGKPLSKKDIAFLKALAAQQEPEAQLVSFHRRRQVTVWRKPDGMEYVVR